jgi:hypothetical protein
MNPEWGGLSEESVGGGGAIGAASGTSDREGHEAIDGVNIKGVVLAAIAFNFDGHHN